MPSVVDDASAIAVALFSEPSADEVVERLGSTQLTAPSLLPDETVSVAGGKVRRGEIPTDTAMTALGAFARFRIPLHELDFDNPTRVWSRLQR